MVLLRRRLYQLPTYHSVTFIRGESQDRYIIQTNTKGWEANNLSKIKFIT